ncbi:MAG TPA: YciI family protein [Pirellulaceae bacterium]|nr:YciI family protein [Pirellulaceae bacterium]HMO91826.1 YciI family protein [Pirellulaceae bacterium]HMP69889.1 YciI family protein [Pirellulaceae bacterium]
MKFICLGYCDEAKVAKIMADDASAIIDQCFAYDDELRRGGHFLGGEALGSTCDSVTLRCDGNKRVVATAGPYAETKEVLGGILLLEADDMNHAIELMSKHPGVQMGPFEIRPANESINRLYAEYQSRHQVKLDN